MSENRQHYIQPEQSEIEACVIAKEPYCPLHEPTYLTSGSTFCVVALFKKDPFVTHRYCNPQTLPANDAPEAYSLTKGQWLMVFRPPLSITIFCAPTQQSRISSAVDTLTLDPECSATGDRWRWNYFCVGGGEGLTC